MMNKLKLVLEGLVFILIGTNMVWGCRRLIALPTSHCFVPDYSPWYGQTPDIWCQQNCWTAQLPCGDTHPACDYLGNFDPNVHHCDCRMGMT